MVLLKALVRLKNVVWRAWASCHNIRSDSTLLLRILTRKESCSKWKLSKSLASCKKSSTLRFLKAYASYYRIWSDSALLFQCFRFLIAKLDQIQHCWLQMFRFLSKNIGQPQHCCWKAFWPLTANSYQTKHCCLEIFRVVTKCSHMQDYFCHFSRIFTKKSSLI